MGDALTHFSTWRGSNDDFTRSERANDLIAGFQILGAILDGLLRRLIVN